VGDALLAPPLAPRYLGGTIPTSFSTLLAPAGSITLEVDRSGVCGPVPGELCRKTRCAGLPPVWLRSAV
jgi:hypothetical protein